MRNITKLVAGAGLAAGSLLTLTVGATAAQASEAPVAKAAGMTVAGGTYQGCPYGAVCIYPQDKGWNNGQPSNVYWAYGAHKLYNQVGNHFVFNNQSGGAGVWLCKGSGGTDCPSYLGAYVYTNYNLTPINSVNLTR
jgi:hypothetical protein